MFGVSRLAVVQGNMVIPVMSFVICTKYSRRKPKCTVRIDDQACTATTDRNRYSTVCLIYSLLYMYVPLCDVSHFNTGCNAVKYNNTVWGYLHLRKTSKQVWKSERTNERTLASVSVWLLLFVVRDWLMDGWTSKQAASSINQSTSFNQVPVCYPGS